MPVSSLVILQLDTDVGRGVTFQIMAVKCTHLSQNSVRNWLHWQQYFKVNFDIQNL